MVTKKKAARPTTRRGKSKQTAHRQKSPPIVSAAQTDTPTVSYGPRHVRAPKRRPWRRQDKRFRARRKLPNVFRLTAHATKLLLNNWKVVGGIVLIYGLLTVILVRGLNGGTNVTELKQELSSLAHGTFGHLAQGFSVFALLLSSSSNAASDAAGAYQTFLFLFVSLAIIWTFRQRLAGDLLGR